MILKRVPKILLYIIGLMEIAPAQDPWLRNPDGSVTLNSVNDRVGIGITPSPMARLHVTGNTYIQNGTLGINNGFFLACVGNTAIENIIGISENALYVGSTNADAGIFTSGQCRLAVKSSGYVGIGTLDPKAPLHVAGAVLADQVRVSSDLVLLNPSSSITALSGRLTVQSSLACTDTISCAGLKIKDWKIDAPDYVFNPSYRLMPLGEIKDSIAVNRHLPGVPSAGTLKNNGMDIAAMNCALLKKVEELTLYILDQERRIRALEARKPASD